MDPLFKQTADYATEYMQSLRTRPVAPTPEAVAATAGFDEPLPEGPTAPGDVIRQLHDLGSPATIAMAGPRFFGFVIGGALPVTVASNWLSTAWDQNTGSYLTASTAIPEQVALKWLLELLQLPAECEGGFVSGATMANFTCLAWITTGEDYAFGLSHLRKRFDMKTAITIFTAAYWVSRQRSSA